MPSESSDEVDDKRVQASRLARDRSESYNCLTDCAHYYCHNISAKKKRSTEDLKRDAFLRNISVLVIESIFKCKLKFDISLF